jgi:RND family efflux transporter MFP subunit
MSLQSLRIDRGAKKPRRRRVTPWFARLLLLAVAAVLLFAFWGRIMRLMDRLRLLEVETARVEAPDPREAGAVRGKAANGYVIAARRAALSADTPGRIVEMCVKEGSVVKQGDVVARLYAEEYEAAVKRARADLAGAEAGLRRSKADLATAVADRERLRRQEDAAGASVESAEARLALRRLQLDRARELLEKQVVTQSEFDDAEAAHRSADADARSAEARLEAATAAVKVGESRLTVARAEVEIAAAREVAASADLERADATLDKTVVRAPFDGVVVLKDAEVGEVVSPNSQGGSSARGSVVTMVDFDSLEVQANVPEASLDAVVIGASASIFLDAFPDRRYEGRVDRIWPTANRQKGTVEVRVVFLEPDEKLRPEMGVRVVFLADDAGAEEPVAGPTTGVLVPEDATVREADRTGVFVLERDVVRFREVRLGPRRGGRVVVESGLSEGDRIVLAPPASLSDGDRVRIKE